MVFSITKCEGMMPSEVESIVEEAIMVFFRLCDVSVQYVLTFKMFLEGVEQ